MGTGLGTALGLTARPAQAVEVVELVAPFNVRVPVPFFVIEPAYELFKLLNCAPIVRSVFRSTTT